MELLRKEDGLGDGSVLIQSRKDWALQKTWIHGIPWSKNQGIFCPSVKVEPLASGSKIQRKAVEQNPEESSSAKDWLWPLDYGACLWETTSLSALVLFPPRNSPL